jgi:hypothetical protein
MSPTSALPAIIGSLILLCLGSMAKADECAAVHPNASKAGYQGAYGGYDANGNCHLRNVSEAQCGQIAGSRYYRDRGAGYTRCEFPPPAGGSGGYSGGGGSCPPGNVPIDGYCIPSGARHCGGGEYCDAGEACIGDGRCLDLRSPRICADLVSFCDDGYRCAGIGTFRCEKDCGPGRVVGSGGGCRPADAVDCGDGDYCDAGHICTKEDKCLSIYSERVCSDGESYCQPGYACNASGKCSPVGSPETQRQPADDPDEEGNGLYIALVATNTGRFYGYGVASSLDAAMGEARRNCIALKMNTGTTAEERAEECKRSVSISNGCVALASSHDMFYGPSESFVGGMATDRTKEGASTEALESCRSKGGANCRVVPESVQCTNVGSNRFQWLR